jgi:hypothetical protein
MADRDLNMANTLARMNAVSLGYSCALLAGAALGGATLLLVLQGSESSYHLGLLAQFFPGYTVTLEGAFVGALWAAGVAFLSVTPVASLYYRNLLSKQSTDSASTTGAHLGQEVARLKKREFGMAVGLLAGTAMFVATALLIINQGEGKPLGPHLKLFGLFLPGYKITWAGSALGFIYLSALGGAAALFVAGFYNRLVGANEK